MSQTDNLDLLGFAEESGAPPSPRKPARLWKLLIVDDETEVHSVTKLALSGFQFAGRELDFLSAYSATQAKKILNDHPDVAIILLDVVMEEDDAGLRLVRYIREELANPLVRIILRTGQPGQAPERQVVTQYDINDYKEKTELTAQKLFTVVYTALSSYRALTGLEGNRRGLVKVIESCAQILEHQSVDNFIQGALEQVAALLFLDEDVIFVRSNGIATAQADGAQTIVAATGKERAYIGLDPREVLPTDINEPIQRTLAHRQTEIGAGYFSGYLSTRTGAETVIFVSSSSPLPSPDRHLIELFFSNVTVGLENLHLRQDIETTQQEVVYLLADAVETRSHETGNHVRRVGEYSRELAVLAGLGERDAEVLRMAAPLHDVGKIGIPDEILNRPGALEGDDWQLMKSHAERGARLLRRSQRPVLKAAAIISEQHHENWDGSGYPRGLAGENIHVFGRIVAIADVFDALCSKRCYKPAWEMGEVTAYVKSQSGRKFDPSLVDLFIENFDLFKAIRMRFPDPAEGG